jgi:hypothetical protein
VSPARRAFAVAAVLYATLALWHFRALLACPAECFVDHAALYGDLARLARNDTRLNAWILSSVQRNLLTAPRALFEANAFHPARSVLAGSEHLIGIALQMLPVRAFTASAVAVHQLALVFSAWALGLSTFALSRWLVRVEWIALAAGAAAMAMPWRSLELMHLQILSSHWLPLLWLLALRILAGEARGGDAPLFAALLAVQLLSSFYVAYLVAVSIGVLALALAVQGAARPRGAARLAAAALPGFALLVAASIPYLARQARGEIAVVPEALWEASGAGAAIAAAAWRALAPRLPGAAASGDALALGYSIPPTLAALALAALALALRPARDPLGRRRRVATLALAGVALAAGILMLGSELRLGGAPIELPAGWLARVLPGFASLRAPLRWAIPIALAAPVLAAIALARAEALARARLGGRAGRAALALPVLALLALDLRAPRLSVEPVWPDAERTRALYAALAALPPGPVLEAPWGAGPLHVLGPESEALLASTLHGRPILNGFTAYPPPSYDLLRRVARGLPGAESLGALARLAGLRWIVLHDERLGPDARRRWRAAEADGRLRRAWSDGRTSILELPARADAGSLAAAVAEPARERTLTGLPRAPLALEAPAGRLAVEGALAPFRLAGVPLPAPVAVAIENASPRDWPGFDASSEGLVLLRYAFADAAGGVARGSVAPLDADVPAGSTLRASAPVLPPARLGRFRLCLDLVQRLGRELHPLPIAPVEVEAEVVGRAPSEPEGELGRVARFAGWLAAGSEVTTYRCAGD